MCVTRVMQLVSLLDQVESRGLSFSCFRADFTEATEFGKYKIRMFFLCVCGRSPLPQKDSTNS